MGIIVTFNAKLSQYDFIGAGFIIRLGITIIIAALLALTLSVCSFRARERKATSTLFFSIPSACLLLFIGGYILDARMHEKKSKADQKLYKEVCEEIRKDSSFYKTKDWERAKAPEKRAFSNSLSMGFGLYTEEQIVDIYENYKRFSVLKHPACPSYILVENFDKAWKECESGRSYHLLSLICSNPNTPVEYLERVATSKTLPVGAVYPARSTLEKIKAKSTSQP